jgi:hypothetical protein
VIDPRLTQSIGLFQFAGLTSNRLLRHAFTDEATGYNDLALKGDLAGPAWHRRVWLADHRPALDGQVVKRPEGASHSRFRC